MYKKLPPFKGLPQLNIFLVKKKMQRYDNGTEWRNSELSKHANKYI